MVSSQDSTATKVADFVISRVLNAPRELAWKAFTESDRIKAWWGPKGFSSVSSKTDLRVGGFHHYALKGPDGAIMWGKLTYREIVRPERLVFITSFSDEAGGLSRHPMAPTWPLEMLTVVTFEEQGGKTRLTVRWLPLDPTEEELRTFDAGRASMNGGWTGTLDQLDAYLAKQ